MIPATYRSSVRASFRASSSAARPARPVAPLSLLLLALLVLTGACTRKIGDNCSTNVDCSPQGDRLCDIGSPQGYCTIEGCDYQTCPNNAHCVRFYSLKTNSGQCQAGLVTRSDCPEDASTSQRCCKPGTPGCCLTGELCLCEDARCASARCASGASEKRSCMAECDDDSDCREGYSCLTTGSNGAEPIPYRNENGVLIDRAPALEALRFCAPSIVGAASAPRLSTVGSSGQGLQRLQSLPADEPGEPQPASEDPSDNETR